MVFSVDLSDHVGNFSEKIALYRYEMTFDANGDRIIGTDNPTIYYLRGSVQALEQDVEWEDEGVNLNESRTLYLPYPYEGPGGGPMMKETNSGSVMGQFDIQIRTRTTQEEDEPVDQIEYDSNSYDLVTKLGGYAKYGSERFIIERVK